MYLAAVDVSVNSNSRDDCFLLHENIASNLVPSTSSAVHEKGRPVMQKRHHEPSLRHFFDCQRYGIGSGTQYGPPPVPLDEKHVLLVWPVNTIYWLSAQGYVI